MDQTVLFSLSYGLYVVSAGTGEKENPCIVNTVMQITDSPKQVLIGINKKNRTHEILKETKVFTISVLEQDTPLELIGYFGYSSGRDKEKWKDWSEKKQLQGFGTYLTKHAIAVLGGQIVEEYDLGTHTVFVGEVEAGMHLETAPALTYASYQERRKKDTIQEKDTGTTKWMCTVCGYIYEGQTLPEGYVCPLCKHGSEVFEKMN